MKTDIRFFFNHYLTRFFLEWEMFQKKVLKKTKTQVLFSVTSLHPPKNALPMRQRGKIL